MQASRFRQMFLKVFSRKRREKRRYQIKKCDVEENLEVIGLRMFIIIDFGRNRFRCERGLRAPPEARVVEEEEEEKE